MYKKISIQYLLSACLLLAISNMAHAENTPLQSLTAPCSYNVYEGYYTKYSSVKFMYKIGENTVRWLCYDGQVLLQTRPNSGGGYHGLWTDHPALEFLQQGKKIVRKNGHSTLLRMVIQESAREYNNLYWLIDLREKVPQVIGPFGEGAGDGSETFEVSWGEEDVAITTGSAQLYTYNYKDKKIIRVQ